MTPWLRTAVANVTGVLMTADSQRNGARVENPTSAPIFLDQAATPSYVAPTIMVPPVDPNGVNGWYAFDGTCKEAWNFRSPGAGDFTLHTW